MNMSNRRKAFVIASLAVGIGLLAWVGFVRQPADEQVAGMMGAAYRYREGQITDKDVVLGDTGTQQFLQSDAFHKLMTDPEARAVLASPGFQAFKDNPGLALAAAGMISRSEFANNPELRKYMADLMLGADFKKTAELAAVSAEFANSPELRKKAVEFMSSAEFANNPELRKHMADLYLGADFKKTADLAQVAEFANNPELRKKAVEFMSSAEFANNPELRKHMADLMLGADFKKTAELAWMPVTYANRTQPTTRTEEVMSST